MIHRGTGNREDAAPSGDKIKAWKLKTLLLITLILAAGLAEGSVVHCNEALAASDMTLDRAIAYYNQGDYKRCVLMLEEACENSLARDGKAHYYLANALVRVERKKDALIQYEIAAALGTGTQLERLAKQGADSLARAGAASLPSQAQITSAAPKQTNATQKSAAPTTPQIASNAATQQTAKNIVARSETEGLPIEIQRQTTDTDSVVIQTHTALFGVPNSIISELRNFGVKVLITPTVLEAMPEMASETPRGYIHGGGYTNCAALYRGAKKTIFIAERVSWLSGLPQPNSRVSDTMLHEMGHALDHCRNFPSAGSAFAAIYKRDADKQSNTERSHFQYYTQEGDAGASELFAQLFSIAVDPHLLQKDGNKQLAEGFPSSLNYIKSLIR